MGLNARLLAKLTAVQTGANDFGGPDFDINVNTEIVLEDGTTVNKADILWADQRTVASASNDDIDLAGVLTNAFGAVITAAEIVAILIINKARDGTANTTNLTIGVGSNPFLGFLGGTTPTVGPLRPGGVFMIASPDAAGIGTVTGGSADILRIANSSGAAATYQIAILARTA